MGLTRFRAKNHPQQVMVSGAASDIDDRATSWEWFAELHARYAFTIDVAASPHNAKLPRYFTAIQDGLALSWGGERAYCNPPFSDLGRWVRKAWLEHHEGVSLIIMIVPANRTEQAWWQDHVEPFRDRGMGLRVEFMRGRRRFIKAGDEAVKANNRPPFGVCLLAWERP